MAKYKVLYPKITHGTQVKDSDTSVFKDYFKGDVVDFGDAVPSKDLVNGGFLELVEEAPAPTPDPEPTPTEESTPKTAPKTAK